MLKEIAILAINLPLAFICCFFLFFTRVYPFVFLPLVGLLCFNGWYIKQLYEFRSTKSAIIYLAILLAVLALSTYFWYLLSTPFTAFW
jgi:hypothetical protein